MSKVAVVVSASSGERFFLPALVRECKVFASQLVVSYAPTRFSGDAEDLSYLSPFRDDPEVTLVEYHVVPGTHNPLTQRPHAYWHNVARMKAMEVVRADVDWILFLDADEVPDGARTKARLETLVPNGHGWKVMNYWYFRDVTHQAVQWEATPILVPRSMLMTPDQIQSHLMQDHERWALTFISRCPEKAILGNDELPLIHHFSWVRPLPDLLKKVRGWGHQNDKPWERLIVESWSKPFDGTDFVHGYQYVQTTNRFDVVLSE